MKYMKNFEGFINENSRSNEGGENELQAQKEIETVLRLVRDFYCHVLTKVPGRIDG
jgi:hypothetical protein